MTDTKDQADREDKDLLDESAVADEPSAVTDVESTAEPKSDDGDDGDDGDDVEQRIAAEADKRAKRYAQKRIDELVAKNHAYERETGELRITSARLEREQTELRKQLDEIRRHASERDTSSEREKVERSIDDIKREISSAYEESEFSRIADLQYQLTQQTLRLDRLSSNGQEHKPTRTPEPKREPESEPEQKQELPKLHVATQRFIDRTPWWARSEKGRNEAIRIENELLSSGEWDFNDALYDEVEARVRKKFPMLYGQRATSPVSGDDRSRGDAQGRYPRGKGEHNRITEEDKAIMRKYNLNPDDPNVRAAWLNKGEL